MSPSFFLKNPGEESEEFDEEDDEKEEPAPAGGCG